MEVSEDKPNLDYIRNQLNEKDVGVTDRVKKSMNEINKLI
jgi:hypothetical protein